MSFKYVPIIIALLVSLVSGCAKKPARPARAVVGERTERAEIVEGKLKGRLSAMNSIKALGNLELIVDGDRRRTDAAIVIVRPDRFRIDAMDFIADVWVKVGSVIEASEPVPAVKVNVRLRLLAPLILSVSFMSPSEKVAVTLPPNPSSISARQ